MIFLSFAENYKNMSTLSVFTKTLFFMHWEGGKDKKKRNYNVFIKLCFCDSKKEVSGIWGDMLRTKIPLQGETLLVNILF